MRNELRSFNQKNAWLLLALTAGMVGHDIRNPLQAITGDLFLAKEEIASMPDSEEKKNTVESLEAIQENVGYISKIVSDLQDFAKPLTPKIEQVNLEQIVQMVVANIDIPENIKVEYSVGKEVSEFKSDQSYMLRMLTNLSNNAIQVDAKRRGTLRLWRL